MPVKVIARDTRLERIAPTSSAGTLFFEVNEETRLQDFFERCTAIATQHGGISTLYLAAQEAEFAFVGGPPEGVYGVVFCREFLQNGNAHSFSLLAEKVGEIVLFLYAAAPTLLEIHDNDVGHPELSRTFHGDGNELCRQIALNAGCNVIAAREVESCSDEDHVASFVDNEFFGEFGEWEGSVITYNARGDITDQWTNLSNLRDSSGAARDPRCELQP